ncbi:hypothetical protein HHI36_018466 [Cryptolaemus montrouzieri]|uniref:FP protein C-terminal domain-containing protein n=1 Tax=Cryptolaemus montrouzieri TaxID=559131 RepID=A0ABD2P010_9CUCU
MSQTDSISKTTINSEISIEESNEPPASGGSEEKTFGKNKANMSQQKDPEIKTSDPDTSSDSYSIEVLPSKAARKPILEKLKRVKAYKRVFDSYKLPGKKLTTSKCGVDEQNSAICLNEYLPKTVRFLLKHPKELKKHGFQFVWCKGGQVHMSKDEGQPHVRTKGVDHAELLIRRG